MCTAASCASFKHAGIDTASRHAHQAAEIAERLDRIAFPGMTANFDAAKSAALAVTMLDWRDFGQAYAAEMIATAAALAEALAERGLPVFTALLHESLGQNGDGGGSAAW